MARGKKKKKKDPAPTEHEPNTERPAPREREIIPPGALLWKELSSHPFINLVNVKKLAAEEDIPDAANLRPTLWKLFLGYLPLEARLWKSELERKRSVYKRFKDGFLMSPDMETIEQIDRDVKRLHPDINFFSGDSQFARSNQDALKNILTVFATLPGIRYVAEMAEILAPIYYVFRNDKNKDNATSAEADAFNCFVEFTNGFKEHFVMHLNRRTDCIRSRISKLYGFLKVNDVELWHRLEVTTNVKLESYLTRWITLILTREFTFADILLLWDTLIAEGPPETLVRVCCAMLMQIRSRLLAGDQTSNLKLLWRYPPINIRELISVAKNLKGSYMHH